MVNRILSFIFIAFISASVMGQGNNAKAILDKTSSAIRNAGDIVAQFSASSASGNMNGTIYIHKNMLHLQSSDIKCWYDGKTLWTYRKSVGEVNITTPTTAEQQNINPYLFINIYKKGFSYAMKETTLRGKSCYEVTITASSNSNKIKRMVVTINKSNYYPLRVNIVRAKSNTIIDILNCCTKQNFKEATFRFNKSDYPHAEIIDLR